MQSNSIQRQYDEVIAPHYDRDPQLVIGRSLDRAIEQIQRQPHLVGNGTPRKVLDLGIGTGRFFEKLKPHAGHVQPFGIDFSEKMIAIARTRIPELTAVVDDATNLDAHFGTASFDLICTHFITGFIPIGVLAPKIRRRLAAGGFWSLIGGTKAGFPRLQKKASLPGMKLLFGGRTLAVDHYVCNPADHTEVVRALESSAFIVRECETFTPRVDFKNLNEFMDFAYYAGWLTPFIQALGLHRARSIVRAVLNAFFFPVQDYHSIEIVLAQKAGSES
jgi:SAM-dependent methyltransferase